MGRKLHIAWLGKKSPCCGNVTYGREVTNALLDRGYRVSFLHFTQAEDPKGDRPAWQEVSIPCLYKSQIYTIPAPRSSKVLKDGLAELAPDLVHASLTLSPLDFRLPDICEELNLPLVATFHPAFDAKLRNLTSGTQHLTYQLYAPALARYDRVIIFSHLQRDMLVRLGVPDHRLTIIPNGVDVQRYCPGGSQFKQSLGIDRLFIYLGRLSTEKNLEALLKAWRSLNFNPTQCRLLIVGDGPLKASLELFYGGVEQGIQWWGFEGNETQRIEMLRSADAFILPSFVEGLSLSLLEAMACGAACLATDAGADGEVLAQGAGIILHPQRVVSELQALLPLFVEHPEFAQILGLKARQRVLDRYTLKTNIDRLESLYQQLLHSPQQNLTR